jgi:hypothetical protein
MTIDPLWIWVAGGVFAFFVLAGLISSAARRRRTARLRERFGVEYDAVLRRTRSRARCERELIERAEEAKTFVTHPLTAEQRKHYREDWRRVEARFVERPTSAVSEADELIGDILRVEGYPPDFDRRAARLSAKSPLLVQHYRAGHDIIGRGGAASTEDLRQAMLHYRMLFDDLVGTRGDDVVRPVISAREISDPVLREQDVRLLREEKRLNN